MYATNCIKPIQFSLMQLHIKNFPFLSFLYFSLFSYLVCFLIFQFVVNTFCSIPFCAKNFCYTKFLWFVIELFISPHYLPFPFSITYRSISIGYKFHATLHFLISLIFHSIPSATPTPTRGMSHNFTTLH